MRVSLSQKSSGEHEKINFAAVRRGVFTSMKGALAQADEGEGREPPLMLYFDVPGKCVPLEVGKSFLVSQLGGAKSPVQRMEPVTTVGRRPSD